MKLKLHKDADRISGLEDNAEDFTQNAVEEDEEYFDRVVG